MKKDLNSTLEYLASVMEDFGTAQVLTSPSDDDRDDVTSTLKDLSLKTIIRDLAVISANSVADDLHAMALRPADYADMKDLPEKMALMLTKALSGADREYFAEMFRQQLRTRG